MLPWVPFCGRFIIISYFRKENGAAKKSLHDSKFTWSAQRSATLPCVLCTRVRLGGSEEANSVSAESASAEAETTSLKKKRVKNKFVGAVTKK